MENHVFDSLRRVAECLTTDRQVQTDLMQEMYVRLLDVRADYPGQPADWYINRCEQHAREYLDAAGHLHNGHDHETAPLRPEQVALISPRLSDRQREVFDRLRQGYGIRETARQLGISHPAVIKHRRKIERVVERLAREGSLRGRIQLDHFFGAKHRAVTIGAS